MNSKTKNGMERLHIFENRVVSIFRDTFPKLEKDQEACLARRCKNAIKNLYITRTFRLRKGKRR